VGDHQRVDLVGRVGLYPVARALDELDPQTARVLEAVPSRAGASPAKIAVSAGVDADTAVRCLGALAAGGYVERCERGWRIRRTDPRLGK